MAETDRYTAGERLVHDAVALGQLQQRRELLLVGVACRARSAEPDRAEADRRVAVDAQRPAEVEIALGAHAPPPTAMPSDVATARSVTPAQATSASSSMSPEHSQRAVAAGGGMQPGLDERPAGLDRARDALAAELAVGAQRDQRGAGSSR